MAVLDDILDGKRHRSSEDPDRSKLPKERRLRNFRRALKRRGASADDLAEVDFWIGRVEASDNDQRAQKEFLAEVRKIEDQRGGFQASQAKGARGNGRRPRSREQDHSSSLLDRSLDSQDRPELLHRAYETCQKELDVAGNQAGKISALIKMKQSIDHIGPQTGAAYDLTNWLADSRAEKVDLRVAEIVGRLATTSLDAPEVVALLNRVEAAASSEASERLRRDPHFTKTTFECRWFGDHQALFRYNFKNRMGRIEVFYGGLKGPFKMGDVHGHVAVDENGKLVYWALPGNEGQEREVIVDIKS